MFSKLKIFMALSLFSTIFINASYAEDLQKDELGNCEGFSHFSLPKPDSNYMTLCKSGYLNVYNTSWKVPYYTVYTLNSEQVGVNNSLSRKKVDFREDTKIPPKYRSYLSDYKGSGYDRGHNVPAEDMSYSSSNLADTYLLSNMSPQSKVANQQIINMIENHIRKSVYLYANGVIYTGNIYYSDHTIGDHGVAVPDKLFKMVIFPEKNECEFFIVPNNATERKDINTYRVTLNKINKATHLYFNFPECGE
jgi:endonuclease G